MNETVKVTGIETFSNGTMDWGDYRPLNVGILLKRLEKDGNLAEDMRNAQDNGQELYLTNDERFLKAARLIAEMEK